MKKTEAAARRAEDCMHMMLLRARELSKEIGRGRRGRKQIERCVAAASECAPLTTTFLLALSNLMRADVAIGLTKDRKGEPAFTVTFHAAKQKCFGKASGARLMLAVGDACVALNANNGRKQ